MAMNILETIDNKTFDDVIMYVFSETGAMGMPAMIECMKRNGEVFAVSYANEATNWEKIKECWPDFRPNKFNGPHRRVAFSNRCMVIGGDSEIETTIGDSYRELCFDVGNHFICKEEHFRALKELFIGSQPHEIILDGFTKILKEGFLKHLSEVEEAYFKQKEADEFLTKAINEIKDNPEYRKRIKECSPNHNTEDLMTVLKEYTGIDMDYMEFNQYCFRRMGY